MIMYCEYTGILAVHHLRLTQAVSFVITGFSTVCKFKSHRRCVFNVSQSCKWTTKANIEKDENCTLPNVSN